MLHFEEITNQNLQEVCLLQVREEQRPFVADNMLSLAEAFATRNEGHAALPFAIYDDDTLIGFVMLGYGTVGDEEEPEIAAGNYCLWRLMLGAAHQGKGYARPILDWVVSYVKGFPCGPARPNTSGSPMSRRTPTAVRSTAAMASGRPGSSAAKRLWRRWRCDPGCGQPVS